MNKISSKYLIYYDKEVIKSIIEKYDMTFMEALKKFLNSKTYKMMEDPEMCMYQFGTPAIFEMWECEVVTGSPLNSGYLRSN